ncbi:MAG: O-antigen ligase family protein [Bacteroidetes bacterium]|nr:O-antigen ligase family protein [Bacteroidota bacterium]
MAVFEKYLGYSDYHLLFPSENFPLIDIYLYPGPTGRTHAGLFNANILGLYCVLLLSPSIGLLFHETHILLSSRQTDEEHITSFKNRVIQYSKIICILLCISLNILVLSWSGSRSAFVGAICLLFLFIIVSKSKMLITTTVCFISFFAFAIFFNLDIIFTKIDQFIPGSNLFTRLLHLNDGSNHLRMQIYDCAIQLIKEKPLLGWEIGSMAFECQERIGRFTNHAHNIFLQLGTEIGLPFTILISLLIFYIFIKVAKNIFHSHFQKNRNYKDVYLLVSFYLGAVSVSIMNIFSVAMLHSYKLLFIYTFFIAIAYSANNFQRE